MAGLAKFFNYFCLVAQGQFDNTQVLAFGHSFHKAVKVLFKNHLCECFDNLMGRCKVTGYPI